LKPPAGWALLWALLAAPLYASDARAAGPEVWAALQDARLAESADRDPGAAIAIYETVLHHLDDGDSLRGELLIQLARARFDDGDIEGARAALVEASTEPVVSARARAWRVQVDAYQRRVQHVPMSENFHSGTGPFVLGWSAAPQAAIGGGDLGLVWHTVVRDGRDDYVLAAVDAQAGSIHRLGLGLQADDIDAQVRVIVEDDGGRRWTAPVIDLAVGQPVNVDLAVADLLPAQPGSPSAVDPAGIRVVMLQDVTAFHSAARGQNQIRVQHFSLR